MRKILKWTGLALISIFLVLQLFRPERTNPPVDESKALFARVHVPAEVRVILERSCFDCHSNKTRWPWYSNIVPVSWLLVRDVEGGREHMNLTEFDRYKAVRAIAKLDMMCEQITNGNMPLPVYLIMHPDARLSKQQIDLICDWVESARDSLLASAE